MAGLARFDTKMMWSMPAPIASSTVCCSDGVSNTGNSSLGTTLVAGKKRVPKPAAGITAVRTGIVSS